MLIMILVNLTKKIRVDFATLRCFLGGVNSFPIRSVVNIVADKNE